MPEYGVADNPLSNLSTTETAQREKFTIDKKGPWMEGFAARTAWQSLGLLTR